MEAPAGLKKQHVGAVWHEAGSGETAPSQVKGTELIQPSWCRGDLGSQALQPHRCKRSTDQAFSIPNRPQEGFAMGSTGETLHTDKQ